MSTLEELSKGLRNDGALQSGDDLKAALDTLSRQFGIDELELRGLIDKHYSEGGGLLEVAVSQGHPLETEKLYHGCAVVIDNRVPAGEIVVRTVSA